MSPGQAANQSNIKLPLGPQALPDKPSFFFLCTIRDEEEEEEENRQPLNQSPKLAETR